MAIYGDEEDCDEGQRFQKHPLLMSAMQPASESFTDQLNLSQAVMPGRGK